MDKKYPIAIFISLAVVLGILLFAGGGSNDEARVRETVESFGQRLERVSLLAPAETLEASLDENYAEFVAPVLLEEWKNDPESALGRRVSSPWPDRIEVSRTERETNTRYVVEGDIIEVASASATSSPTEVARMPVTFILAEIDGKWLITSAETGPYETTSAETFETGEFSLDYPADWRVETGPGLGGRYLISGDAATLVRISFPEDAFSKERTNFADGYFVLSRSSDPAAVSGCGAYTDLQGMRGPERDPITVNGAVFIPQETSNAGAGNLYTTRLYRTVREDACYEAALTVHTTNVANYPEGTVSEFDKEQAFERLESIFASLSFK